MTLLLHCALSIAITIALKSAAREKHGTRFTEHQTLCTQTRRDVRDVADRNTPLEMQLTCSSLALFRMLSMRLECSFFFRFHRRCDAFFLNFLSNHANVARLSSIFHLFCQSSICSFLFLSFLFHFCQNFKMLSSIGRRHFHSFRFLFQFLTFLRLLLARQNETTSFSVQNNMKLIAEILLLSLFFFILILRCLVCCLAFYTENARREKRKKMCNTIVQNNIKLFKPTNRLTASRWMNEKWLLKLLRQSKATTKNTLFFIFGFSFFRFLLTVCCRMKRFRWPKNERKKIMASNQKIQKETVKQLPNQHSFRFRIAHRTHEACALLAEPNLDVAIKFSKDVNSSWSSIWSKQKQSHHIWFHRMPKRKRNKRWLCFTLFRRIIYRSLKGKSFSSRRNSGNGNSIVSWHLTSVHCQNRSQMKTHGSTEIHLFWLISVWVENELSSNIFQMCKKVGHWESNVDGDHDESTMKEPTTNKNSLRCIVAMQWAHFLCSTLSPATNIRLINLDCCRCKMSETYKMYFARYHAICRVLALPFCSYCLSMNTFHDSTFAFLVNGSSFYFRLQMASRSHRTDLEWNDRFGSPKTKFHFSFIATFSSNSGLVFVFHKKKIGAHKGNSVVRDMQTSFSFLCLSDANYETIIKITIRMMSLGFAHSSSFFLQSRAFTHKSELV